MEKMLFTSPQPEVTIRILPDGKRDVTVLADEEIVEAQNQTEPSEEAESPGEKTETAYQYSGNQFRTVHELTEEDILLDKEKYLNYTAENEPTLEQLRHDKEITNTAIDNYTLELMEGGLL